ncbi:unnamed protein product [Natator depressus]
MGTESPGFFFLFAYSVFSFPTFPVSSNTFKQQIEIRSARRANIRFLSAKHSAPFPLVRTGLPQAPAAGSEDYASQRALRGAGPAAPRGERAGAGPGAAAARGWLALPPGLAGLFSVEPRLARGLALRQVVE